MKVTVLIPMYNESAILPDTLARLSSYARKTFEGGYELLFVDDGSTDGSAEIVEAFSDEAVRLLRYAPNRGKGCAVRTGMLEARGEHILFTDCDLAYGTGALGELYALMQASPGVDVAVASRALHPAGYEGYSVFRRLLSRAYCRLLRLFFGLRLSDSQSGLKGFTQKAATAIFSRCQTDRFAFDFEAIMIGERLGLRFAELPARVVSNRRRGKLHPLRDSLRMLKDLPAIARRVRRMQPQGRPTVHQSKK